MQPFHNKLSQNFVLRSMRPTCHVHRSACPTRSRLSNVAVALIASWLVSGGALTAVARAATPKQALASPTLSTQLVYLYDANDNPVLAANATIQQGSVYDDGLCIGAINPMDSGIYNAGGTKIGFVTTQPDR